MHSNDECKMRNYQQGSLVNHSFNRNHRIAR